MARKNGIGNVLYYGDNLEILREKIRPASVDLFYLDPPFNSSRSYNVLFADKHGTKDTAHPPLTPFVQAQRAVPEMDQGRLLNGNGA
jgi:hypothetical protein